MRVLVVKDEQKILKEVSDYIEKEGYFVDATDNYTAGSVLINDYDYDCAIIDINLPDGSGLNLIKELRILKSDVGIIVVSANQSLEDRVKGLVLGADDYVVKPFHLAELGAHIHSLLRRRKFDVTDTLVLNELSIDLRAKEISVNGKNVELTPKEFQILLFLVSNKNRVVSKQALADHLLGNQAEFISNYDFLYAQLKNLRKKVFTSKSSNQIKMIYGVGYKLETNETTQ